MYYLSNVLNDKRYAQFRYFLTFKKWLNLKNPKGLNEKIQWIKLYDRREILTELADKYRVRNYVGKKIGSKYLNELVGVYEEIKDINIDELPHKFVLKANHGSSWNVICDNKNILNWNLEKAKMESWLQQNFYKFGREWCYKNIKPKIICEKYLGKNLLDYKLYCFNGKAEYVQIDIDRFANHRREFYDRQWKKQVFTTSYPTSSRKIKKPNCLREMFSIAAKLSSDFSFVRVDLYLVKNKIIFGEMTFYPDAGFSRFHPEKYDLLLGKKLKINIK